MSIGGVPAPIYQLSNTNGKQQVTFQTPCEVSPTNNATAVLQISGASATVTGVLIVQAQPGIFFYTGSNGKTMAKSSVPTMEPTLLPRTPPNAATIIIWSPPV